MYAHKNIHLFQQRTILIHYWYLYARLWKYSIMSPFPPSTSCYLTNNWRKPRGDHNIIIDSLYENHIFASFKVSHAFHWEHGVVIVNDSNLFYFIWDFIQNIIILNFTIWNTFRAFIFSWPKASKKEVFYDVYPFQTEKVDALCTIRNVIQKFKEIRLDNASKPV
jgi:hypothetical protein